nr:plasmid mobilization relaxosome protein MobC [Rubrivirga marina]
MVPLADAAARKALRRIGVNLNQLVRRANAGGATEAKAQAAIAEVRAAVARVGRAAGDDGLEGTP